MLAAEAKQHFHIPANSSSKPLLSPPSSLIFSAFISVGRPLFAFSFDTLSQVFLLDD